MGYYRKVDTHTNLLVYSEEIDVGSGTAAWNNNGNGLTVTQNNAVAPDGTMTAETLEQSATVAVNRSMRQDYTARAVTYAGEWFTHSIWARKIFGSDATPIFRLNLIADGTPVEQQSEGLNLTGAWTRFDYTVQCPSDASTYVQFAVEIGWDTDGAAHDNVIAIWGAQAVRGRSIEPYIPTTSAAVTAATMRDNHWSKDHNGIWRRHFRLEGPRNGYSEWTNLIDYSAGPYDNIGTWAGLGTRTTVASCIEGGSATKVVSASDGIGRWTVAEGSYSDNVEVASAIFEEVDQEQSHILVFGTPSSNYVSVRMLWASDSVSPYHVGASAVDYGMEDLGIGPNGGRLRRIWIAFDSSQGVFTGQARAVQFRTDSNIAASETGILHHAQYIEIPSGYSNSDNGASTGPIVNLSTTNNSINRESFRIPITFDPQEVTAYCRFKQMWRDGQHSAFSIGGSGGANLYAQNNNGTSGTFFGRFHDGSLQSTCLMGSSAIAFGDTVELVLTLYSDGHVKGWTSINGGAWETGTDGDTTPTIPASWGNDNAYINCSTAISDASGFIDLQAFKIVDKSITTDAECDWLRGYKETGTYEY
jgi:hypothetical protein